nr:MAG TPA: hypothetical protein [Bacteriophage sp.]
MESASEKTTAVFSFVEPDVPNILLISSSVNTATESFLAATVFIIDPALIFGIFLFNSEKYVDDTFSELSHNYVILQKGN